MNRVPPAVRAYANTYECTDCDSETKLAPDIDQSGIWRITVLHDDGCPVLTGHVSRIEAGAGAAARVPGTAYIGQVNP